jgi:hypothetical protein
MQLFLLVDDIRIVIASEGASRIRDNARLWRYSSRPREPIAYIG